jgi:hypothetical protein
LKNILKEYSKTDIPSSPTIISIVPLQGNTQEHRNVRRMCEAVFWSKKENNTNLNNPLVNYIIGKWIKTVHSYGVASNV